MCYVAYRLIISLYFHLFFCFIVALLDCKNICSLWGCVTWFFESLAISYKVSSSSSCRLDSLYRIFRCMLLFNLFELILLLFRFGELNIFILNAKMRIFILLLTDVDLIYCLHVDFLVVFLASNLSHWPRSQNMTYTR